MILKMLQTDQTIGILFIWKCLGFNKSI